MVWRDIKGQLALFSSVLLLYFSLILSPLELCGVASGVLAHLNAIGLPRTALGTSH